MKHPDIPSFAYRLFSWFCREEFFEELEGDLEERFLINKELFGLQEARKIYRREVLKMIRPSIIGKLSGTTRLNTYGMFKNNLRVAFRNLIKQKEYTLINVFGLATSLAISMLIILFLIDQDRMDEHNGDADRIYRVITEYDDPSRERIRSMATSPYALDQLVTFNVDQAEATSQLIKEAGSIKYEDRLLNFSGLYAAPNFFTFFDYELMKGSVHTALDNSNGIVLSEAFATKLFNTEDPVGKVVTLNDLGSFSVTGVVKEDIKSHLDFDLLLPKQAYEVRAIHKVLMEDWAKGSRTFYNYVRLDEGTEDVALTSFLSGLDTQFPEEEKSRYAFSLQRLDEINLGKLVGNEVGITTPGFVFYFFMVLAGVLMLSSGFNYMNLAVARGLKRAKEVGVRKVIGAGKRQIFFQFLLEAQVIMFTSFALAYGMLQLLVPIFNNLKILRDVNGAITMNFNANLTVYLVFFAFTFLIGLIAGFYPAAYLSSFRPLQVLKGANNTGKRPSFRFRKVLVFFQYSFSIIFIITTIVLYQQAKSFATFDYGFNQKNVLNVAISNVPYETFRNELLKHSEIEGVSAISNLPILSRFEAIPLTRKNDGSKDDEFNVATFSVDPYTIENLQLSLMAGSMFDENQTDTRDVIINEKAMKALGYESPHEVLNETFELTMEKDQMKQVTNHRIIGVIRDFSYEFTFKESGPLVMIHDPSKWSMINIRFGNVPTDQAAEVVESVWKEFDNVHPFEYESYQYSISDIDEEFSDLVNIVGLVAFFALLIATLGQFSMVVHHIQLRVKEVGIRKVLGSSNGSLQCLLSKDFLIIIALAMLLSTPVAWKINALWTGLIYQSVGVSWMYVGMGVGIILLLSLTMVYVLVRKAALSNPVDSIGYE